MYSKLKELMGEEDATVLIEHLPPLGWADVATKRDLDMLRTELKSDFEKLEYRFDASLASNLNNQTKLFVGWMLGAMTVLIAATAGFPKAWG